MGDIKLNICLSIDQSVISQKEVKISVSSAYTLAVWRSQNRIKRKDQPANRQLYSYYVTTIFSKPWVFHIFCGQYVQINAAAVTAAAPHKM